MLKAQAQSSKAQAQGFNSRPKFNEALAQGSNSSLMHKVHAKAACSKLILNAQSQGSSSKLKLKPQG